MKQKKSTIKTFDKEKIQILIGQYGPYIKQGRKNFKIPKVLEANDLTLNNVCIAKTLNHQNYCKKSYNKKEPAVKKQLQKTTTKRVLLNNHENWILSDSHLKVTIQKMLLIFKR